MICLIGLVFLRIKYSLFLFMVSIGYLVMLMLRNHIYRPIEVARGVLATWRVWALSSSVNSSFLHYDAVMLYKPTCVIWGSLCTIGRALSCLACSD